MTDLRDIRIDGKSATLDIAEASFDTNACFAALNDYYTRKSQFLIDDFFTTVKEGAASRSLFHGDTKLRVPLGLKDNRVYEMEFDLTQLCHSLFIGRSGSGKTSILHSFILSIMNAYSPNEVAIYLADYKGNEFACYRENAPHVRYLLCKNGKKNDNETTFYSMFQSIRKIHEERSILIRQKGVNNFLQYNDLVAEAEKMPFIFFIVDEYNSLLDDFKAKYGNKLINLINELTRMVRSSGICVMLSGQQLDDKLNLDNIQYKFIVSADSGSLGRFFNVKGDVRNDLLQFLSIPKEGRVLVGTVENSGTVTATSVTNTGSWSGEGAVNAATIENSGDFSAKTTQNEFTELKNSGSFTLTAQAEKVTAAAIDNAKGSATGDKVGTMDFGTGTDLDVTGIAGRCGFANPGYYARIFRRKMGCTPLQYRKNRRES